MELLPAIDLRDGRCVRLYQGDFAQETLYATDPRAILERYLSFGARRVHVVDLDGARDGAQANHALVADLARQAAAVGACLQVGGGLRTLARVETLLAGGVERAVVGSVAVTQRETVAGWFAKVGADRLVLAFDVRLDDAGVPRLTTHGWQQQSTQSLWEAVAAHQAAGLRHVLCTDIARDGALTGPNIDLYREAVERFPAIRWQASGGIAGVHDLHALAACRVGAAISGKALLENRIAIEELQSFLPGA